MDELIKAIDSLKQRLVTTRAALDLEGKKKRAAELQQLMFEPSFWRDRKRAETLSQEAAELGRFISFWERIAERIDDLRAVASEDKLDQSGNLRSEIEEELAALARELDGEEVRLWLGGPHDSRPAILTIYSGAGGVDAQDWAEMLSRMYLRFSENNGYRASMLQRTAGQEAGIKNMTIRVEGPYAYGYLKAESGVHRLVRLSPYDADQARHTSFAMVEVLPELDEPTTIEVSKDDVRVDVFRSSGHGGQSVNTTDSAVRLTHIPTGITVACQNERSQMQNKEQAWKILLGKLEKYYQSQREEERAALRGEFTEAAWGNQIRSYVIHPYKLVKDHRTKFESKNPDQVLDGGIMPFIEAELRRQAAAGSS